MCPPEILLPIPAIIALPGDAVLQGNAAGLAYAAARWRREEMLAARLSDAAGDCPR